MLLALQVSLPFFMLVFIPKQKKWDSSPDSAPDNQCGRRACARTKEANISSGCSLPPVQSKSYNGVHPKTRSSETVQAASQSSEAEPIDLPSSPVKDDANPDDRVTVEASGNTGYHDRNSDVGVSEDDIIQGGNESISGDDLWESMFDCSPWVSN